MTTAQLAQDIADADAADSIATMCPSRWISRVEWYDVDLAVPGWDHYVRRAVAYLTKRGLLIRHKTEPGVVRVKNERRLGKKSLRAFRK